MFDAIADRRTDSLSLGTRVALGVAVLIALTALGMMTLIASHLRDSVTADRHVLLSATAQSDEARLRQKVDDLRRNVLFLSQTPPVQGIVRAARNKGFDHRDGNSLGTWKLRLGEIFSAFAEARPEYLHVRYVGVADQGREIVRVDLRDGYAVSAPREQLQHQADRDFFQAALKLKAGEVHLAEISLDTEQGKVGIPRTPVLRAATPVFGPDGAVFGVVVVNLDFHYLSQDLALHLTPDVTTHIANSAGDYLLHPGDANSFDPGRRYRWQDELPGLQMQPAMATEEKTPLQRLSSAGGMVYAVTRQVAIDPLQPERHLRLIYTFPETVIDDYVQSTRHYMFIGVAISSLLILVLLLWLVRRTFAPLGRLTQAAQAIAAGRYDQPLPEGGAGELGTLVHSFRTMQESIALRDEQSRVIVETAIDGFWMTDKEGRILDVNDSYARLSGYTRNELLTMRVADLKTNESPDQVQLNMLEAKRIGTYRFESDHRHKNGTPWPVEATVTYWPIGDGRFFAFLRDVSERKAAERERSERTNLLRSVMDALRSSIAVLSPQGIVIGVNSAWRDFAASNAGSDLLQGGMGLDYLAVCRDAAGSDPLAAEALAGLEAVRDGRLPAFSLEYPCHSPETRRWFIMSARPLAGADQGLVVAHFDITERKLAESVTQRDREQQEVLRRMLEIVIEGRSVEASLTRVLHLLLSVSWLSLLPRGGVFRMEEDGNSLRLVVAHNLAPELLLLCAQVPLGYCHCGRAAATNTMQYAAHVDGKHDVAFPDMADHGHYCLPITSGTRKLGVLMLYVPVATPRDPYAEKFLASVADILATYFLRTEAEQTLLMHQHSLEEKVKSRTVELQTSEARARAVLTTMLDGVVHIDADGIILSVNNAIQEMFGYEEEELVGHNVRILMPEPHAAAHDGYLHRYAQTRQARLIGTRREAEGRRKDGSLFAIELAVNEMVDDHGNSFLGVIRDITAQKAALHAAQIATQAKGRFLANMSHEIRTPLNAVIGFAQIGMRDGAGSPAGQTFGRIADAGEHLLGVINDILDFSKIEAGKLKIERQPFALRAAIDGVVSFVSGRAAAKNTSLSVSLAPDLPQWVVGDGLRLAQILTNLVSNAIKFTPSGEVRLRVARDGDNTWFRIIDTGIGMNDEQVARLFQPFEQADTSTTRTYGGTGLGLAISIDLARLMGGDISVDSGPGAGSSFTLQLPLPATAPERSARPLPAEGPGLSGISVLAADDIEINRLVLEDLLVHEGAKVVFAENGQQAIERLKQAGTTAFDVVLMDVQMPLMDGIEATGRIRVIAPALPVIGLTAHAMAEEREKCLAAGMADVVTKPIDLRVLVEAIRRQARSRDTAEPAGKDAAFALSPNPATGHPSGTSFGASPEAKAVDSAIDWPALLARFSGRSAFVMKLAASACEHHAGTPAKLRAATRLGDREALGFMAHSLKGMSGNLEARRLHELARAVEAAMRAGEDIVEQQGHALAQALEALLAELADFTSEPEGR
ncbi:MAG: PAS domain S-box protein [Rhodocyclales bacterium]|nr:PAS domain S-box protein [Rhodocyclales bacterium]